VSVIIRAGRHDEGVRLKAIAIWVYDKMGGVYVRDSSASEFGRVLPVVGVGLTQT
jgi:hypothetical protein